MRPKTRRIFITVLLVIAVILPAALAGYYGISEGMLDTNLISEKQLSDSESYVAMAADKKPEEEQALIDMSGTDLSKEKKSTDDAIDVLLAGGTKAFFGGYDANEDFLGFVSRNYGKATLNAIADQGIFDDPDVWYNCCGSSIHVLWTEYLKDAGIDNGDNIIEIKSEKSGKVTFAFTGDLSLAEGIATVKYIDSKPNGLSDGFSQELLSKMRGYDVFVVNNEFCYSDRGTAIPGKAYTFRADPDRVKQLDRIGTDVVSLANNHVFDFGETAFSDTLKTVKKAGYPYIGAGMDLNEAKKAVYYIACGRKIAIIAGTQIERSYTYTRAATRNKSGVMKCLYPDEFCEAIKYARANADYVLVFTHWGTEGCSNYGYDQTMLAQRFVQSGADVIIGGHTHCLQGMEYIGDVPVYYSLGNFWFASTKKMPSGYDTGLAEITVKGSGDIKCSFLPCRFEKGVTSIAEGKDKKRILSFLNSHSDEAKIDKSGTISKK